MEEEGAWLYALCNGLLLSFLAFSFFYLFLFSSFHPPFFFYLFFSRTGAWPAQVEMGRNLPAHNQTSDEDDENNPPPQFFNCLSLTPRPIMEGMKRWEWRQFIIFYFILLFGDNPVYPLGGQWIPPHTDVHVFQFLGVWFFKIRASSFPKCSPNHHFASENNMTTYYRVSNMAHLQNQIIGI